MRYWTSDFHFGHANIINYCNRPFDNVRQMDEYLVDNWNATVQPEDEVCFLGDFAMGKLVETLPFASLLNGYKILIPGNHDSCWKGKKPQTEKAYLEAGFDEVRQAPSFAVLSDETLILADHFPYSGDSKSVDRFTEYRPVDKGSWLLHGHVHDAWRQRGRQINVGIDAWGGRMPSDDDVIDLVKAGPADRDCLSWIQGDYLRGNADM